MRTELILSCFCPFEAPEKAQVCRTGHPRVRSGTNDSNYTPRAAGLPPPSLPWNLFSASLSLGVRSIVQNFRVEGASMEPTLQTGQYLLISKASYFHVEGTPLDRLLPITHQGSTDYLFGGPQRGDVVVFRAPTQPDKDFIKRVIGLPGDTVEERANGDIYVNGRRLVEPYLNGPKDVRPQGLGPWHVPKGDLFVLGDNRTNSNDSRFGLGYIPLDKVVGKAFVIIWPPSRFGGIAGGGHFASGG